MYRTKDDQPPIEQSGYLPAWWRHILVAAAMLILCSCRGLPVSPAQTALASAVAENPDEPPRSWVTDNLQVVPAQTAPIVSSHVVPSAGLASCGCTAHAGAACTPIGSGDEFLCDGGDFGSPAGVRADWTVDGLEQEDAVAHYDTLDGRVLVTPSNRVCIYAPRFAAVRQVVNPMTSERGLFIDEVVEDQSLAKAAIKQPVASSLQRHMVSVDLAAKPPILFRQRQQAGGLENLQASMDAYTSLAPYANLQIIRVGKANGIEQARVQRAVQHAITWTGNQAPQVVFGTRAAQAQMGVRQPEIIYQTNGPESPRLRLLKLASTGHALPGEEVEFTLRFDNVGDQVIGNVTIIDNLATRLEYVPDSARTSVDATLVTTPNEGGSTILRWEIKPPLEPGQGGILQFRARVR